MLDEALFLSLYIHSSKFFIYKNSIVFKSRHFPRNDVLRKKTNTFFYAVFPFSNYLGKYIRLGGDSEGKVWIEANHFIKSGKVHACCFNASSSLAIGSHAGLFG